MVLFTGLYRDAIPFYNVVVVLHAFFADIDEGAVELSSSKVDSVVKESAFLFIRKQEPGVCIHIANTDSTASIQRCIAESCFFNPSVNGKTISATGFRVSTGAGRAEISSCAISLCEPSPLLNKPKNIISLISNRPVFSDNNISFCCVKYQVLYLIAREESKMSFNTLSNQTVSSLYTMISDSADFTFSKTNFLYNTISDASCQTQEASNGSKVTYSGCAFVSSSHEKFMATNKSSIILMNCYKSNVGIDSTGDVKLSWSGNMYQNNHLKAGAIIEEVFNFMTKVKSSKLRIDIVILSLLKLLNK